MLPLISAQVTSSVTKQTLKGGVSSNDHFITTFHFISLICTVWLTWQSPQDHRGHAAWWGWGWRFQLAGWPWPSVPPPHYEGLWPRCNPGRTACWTAHCPPPGPLGFVVVDMLLWTDMKVFVFIFLLTRVSITAVSLACKNSREETTKTLRSSKDEKKVRKNDTGSWRVGGVFSKRNFETLQTGSRTMQAAAGLPLLSGSYATSCKPFPLSSLCSCAAALLQNHWQLGKWTKQ